MDSEKSLEQARYVQMVIDFVSKRGGVTFVELQSLLESSMEVKGDLVIYVPGYENIILWAGISQEFFQVVTLALNSHQIMMRPTQLLVYLVDGGALNMPIAKSARHYQTPHWLPVSFSKWVDEPLPKKRRKPEAPNLSHFLLY